MSSCACGSKMAREMKFTALWKSRSDQVTPSMNGNSGVLKHVFFIERSVRNGTARNRHLSWTSRISGKNLCIQNWTLTKPDCPILSDCRNLNVDPDVQSRVRHWTFDWFLVSWENSDLSTFSGTMRYRAPEMAAESRHAIRYLLTTVTVWSTSLDGELFNACVDLRL